MQVLFARHHVRVYQFVLRLVHNQATAEDLISEVFLDIWRQAGRFEGRSAVTTWMLGIARFKALSALRRRQEDELDEETAEWIEDHSDDPEPALAKKDKGAVLRQRLTALSAEHREVIDLVYYASLSPRALAWSASAAVLAILLQAGLLADFALNKNPRAGFETASAPSAALDVGAFTLIRFAPQASFDDIDKFLQANKLSIVAGPVPGGLYKVRVADKALPKAELNQIVGKLQQDKLVSFIAAAQEPGGWRNRPRMALMRCGTCGRSLKPPLVA